MRRRPTSVAYADGMRIAPILGLFAMGGLALAQPTTNPQTAAAPSTKVAARKGPDRVNWWNDRTFYEIFVRSFADSKTGPLAGDGIGDLQGLIEHLDYLNDGNPETTTDLGIGGIWLMPICPSPSYHGYDITNYLDVNPQYGTLDDFKRLSAECHKRDIKVIVDFVMNHTSNRHPYFAEAQDPKSPKHDWYIWSDTDPGWKGPWKQKVWHRAPVTGPDATETYYYGLFSPVMPDLNFRNRMVTEEMKLITSAWLSRFGADGFRLDAIRHLIEEGQVQENTPATHAWLKDWFLYYKGVNMDAMTIGEVWADSEQASSYVGKQMDMAFEFALADAMIASVKAGKKDPFIAAQRRVLDLYPPNQYGRFLTNHDQARIMTQLKGDTGAMRAAAALLLTGPGVPFIYYGEEIGMTGDKPDEMIRTPMQWGPGENAGFSTAKPWERLNPGFENFNVEKQAADPDSLFSLYRKLIHIRYANPALATGGTWLIDSDKPEVVAYLRHREIRFRPNLGPGARTDSSRSRLNQLLIVVNVSDHEVADTTLSLSTSPLRNQYTGKDLLGAPVAGPLDPDAQGGFTGYKPAAKLAPRQAMIIELTSEVP